MVPRQKILHSLVLKTAATVHADRNSTNCLYIFSMDCTKIDNSNKHNRHYQKMTQKVQPEEGYISYDLLFQCFRTIDSLEFDLPMCHEVSHSL